MLNYVSNHLLLQECITVGCVPSAAVAIFAGGCLPQCMLGYHPSGAVTPRDQAPPQSRPPRPGTPLPPRSRPPVQVHPPGSRQPPPRTRHPSCGQTDACKNITFATSLRTVIIGCSDSNCSTCYLNIATSAGLSHTPH